MPGLTPPREGQTAINKRTGERAVYQGGQWVREKAPAQAGAEQRGRLNLGVGPMVQAEQNLSAMSQGRNPLNEDWGAAAIDALDDNPVAQFIGLGTSPLAKRVGGQDYQDFTQAAKAFEAQLMPIMSGAAVTPSEAQRQIRAALPQLGDSPDTLQRKAHMRKMMLNGAAKSLGAPLPYPDVPTFGVNTDRPPEAQTRQPSGPVRVNTPEEAMRLPPGTQFLTPDGRLKVR